MECKYPRLLVHFLTKRINRYIMECKCFGTHIPEMVYTELIDTLWNVNSGGR